MKRKTIFILMMACMILVCFSCHKEEELEKTPPEGALTHAFSVSPTKKVYFAKGNLQYRASTDTWRFAENQWDTIGRSNRHRSATYDGWIDLFCYGSSGYNGAEPYEFYNEDAIFGAVSQREIAQTKYDWGVYNPISNAGNKAGLWRTLTYDELVYMLYERAFMGYPFSLGTLGLSDGSEIVGVFVFPDDCILYYDGYPTSNKISMSETELVESGIVFLPHMGYMDDFSGGHFSSSYLSVYFWGSSRESIVAGHDNDPVVMEFVSDYLWPLVALTRYYGGVRLVSDCN